MYDLFALYMSCSLFFNFWRWYMFNVLLNVKLTGYIKTMDIPTQDVDLLSFFIIIIFTKN